MKGSVRKSVVAVVLGMSLVACSGGSDDPTPETSDSTSGSAGSTPSSGTSEGPELTAPGSELGLGETATVSYEVRQGVEALLDIKVTRLEKTSFKKSFSGWDLNASIKKTKPYFVRVTITNLSETDLAERPVPLYIVDGNDTLIEATKFKSKFKPCTPSTFPKKFGEGATAKVCLVYLAPDKGDLTAVSFRPTQEDLPITWTGKLKTPRPIKKAKNQKNQKSATTDS
ncbi:hypothetical protein [Nocardioides sp.]|uniref:hypothetical protein n=1 Tax=Nocardioides sp. TaxID=35761 RepID=UPI003565B6D8